MSPVSSSVRQLSWAPLWYAVVGALAIVALDLLTKAPSDSLTREAGGIELATALLYGYAAFIWLWINPGDVWKSSWQIPAAILLMMGRELDLDKKLTAVGILKPELYLTSEAPLMHRLLGALVLAAILGILYRLARKNGQVFLDELRRHAGWALSIGAAVGFAIVSKSIDGIGRKLLGIIDVSPQAKAAFAVVEETLELVIPILILMAILAASHGLTSRLIGKDPQARTVKETS